MDFKKEYYLFFVECIKHLNNAWVILKTIKDETCNPKLVKAAFQYYLVEYAKPFINSKGFLKNYRLKKTFVPSSFKELHERIIDSRNQIHAHGDLTVLEAKVFVKNTPYGKTAGSVQNVIYGSEEIENVDTIIDMIERILDQMYIEEKKLEQSLPIDNVN